MKALLLTALFVIATPVQAAKLDVASCIYMGQLSGLNDAIKLDRYTTVEAKAKASQENAAMSLMLMFGPLGCTDAFASASTRYAIDFMTTGDSLRRAEKAYLRKKLAQHQKALNT